MLWHTSAFYWRAPTTAVLWTTGWLRMYRTRQNTHRCGWIPHRLGLKRSRQCDISWLRMYSTLQNTHRCRWIPHRLDLKDPASVIHWGHAPPPPPLDSGTGIPTTPISLLDTIPSANRDNLVAKALTEGLGVEATRTPSWLSSWFRLAARVSLLNILQYLGIKYGNYRCYVLLLPFTLAKHIEVICI